MGHRISNGLCPMQALAAALGNAISLRRHGDPGRELRQDGVVVPDVSYTYADAVRDGICRPVAS